LENFTRATRNNNLFTLQMRYTCNAHRDEIQARDTLDIRDLTFSSVTPLPSRWLKDKVNARYGHIRRIRSSSQDISGLNCAR